MKTKAILYRILATRTNGETLYFCDHPMQGGRFVPCSQSMAALFRFSVGERMIAELAPVYAGLRLSLEIAL